MLLLNLGIPPLFQSTLLCRQITVVPRIVLTKNWNHIYVYIFIYIHISTIIFNTNPLRRIISSQEFNCTILFIIIIAVSYRIYLVCDNSISLISRTFNKNFIINHFVSNHLYIVHLRYINLKLNSISLPILNPPLVSPCLLLVGMDSTNSTNSTPTSSPSYPKFIREDIDFWFYLLELRFPENLSESMKLHELISLLPVDITTSVKGALRDASSSPAPYTSLKRAILQKHSVSTEDRIAQLLQHQSLGDRTPSEFLSHLKSLLGSTSLSPSETSLLRQRFLQQLPTTTREILVAFRNASLDELAESADSIFRLHQHNSSNQLQYPLNPHLHNPVATVSLDSAIERRFENLERRVDELSNLVRQLTYSRPSRPPERHRHTSPASSSHHTTSRSRSSSQARKNDLCWYHSNFGIKASKCIEPCSFPKNG